MSLSKFFRSLLQFSGVFGLNFGGSDGGGGGGTQTNVADLPNWAKPTAQRLLSRAEALTDINQNPYNSYTGQRVAGLSALQKQAFSNASSINTGPQAFAKQVGQYMSPYQQGVIDVEKNEAARRADMLGQQQQAQATQAGAFGGYRDALQRAERERNLMQEMGNIQTRGSQAAYDRAADQFRSGITQNMALNQQLAQFGGAQQQIKQARLDTDYQDFLNQQRYPYQQLEVISNILRGTPMGSVNTLYNSAPTLGSQLLGAGTAMYGASRLFGAKEGGVVSDVEPKKKRKPAGLAELALKKI